MSWSKWLVVHPDSNWYLQIPKPYRTWELAWILWHKVFCTITDWNNTFLQRNSRVAFQHFIALPWIRRDLRVHELWTFLPPWSDLRGVLDWEEQMSINEFWYMELSAKVCDLFAQVRNRSRIILLQGGEHWFAISFQKRYPKHQKKN